MGISPDELYVLTKRRRAGTMPAAVTAAEDAWAVAGGMAVRGPKRKSKPKSVFSQAWVCLLSGSSELVDTGRHIAQPLGVGGAGERAARLAEQFPAGVELL